MGSILEETNVKIQQMVHKLRHVTGSGLHQELSPGQTREFNLCRDVPTLCKIPINDQTIPCKVKLDYYEED